MLTQDKGKRKKEEEPSNLFAAKGFAPGPSWVNLPGGSNGKSVCLKCGRPGFNRWVGKILWRRKWQPIPVLLLGKFHGWRNLVGYTPWDCKESDTAEWLTHLLIPCNIWDILKIALGASQMVLVVKNPPANMGEVDSTSGLGPWTKKWQCTPVFLPEKSHGQRSPWTVANQAPLSMGSQGQTQLSD